MIDVGGMQPQRKWYPYRYKVLMRLGASAADMDVLLDTGLARIERGKRYDYPDTRQGYYPAYRLMMKPTSATQELLQKLIEQARTILALRALRAMR